MLFFGGSFDPPHLGHTALPQAVLSPNDFAPPLAGVVYVPASRSPHKASAPTAPHHRIEMLRLACAGTPACLIWTEEIDRARHDDDRPSYWADTWRSARAQREGACDRFLIGADQALSMHRWHLCGTFWRDAIVMLREDQDSPATLIEAMRALGVWTEDDLAHWRGRVVRTPMVDASSTHIRACLSDPRRRENPIVGLDDRVHEYILKHALYRA